MDMATQVFILVVSFLLYAFNWCTDLIFKRKPVNLGHGVENIFSCYQTKIFIRKAKKKKKVSKLDPLENEFSVYGLSYTINSYFNL